MSNALIKKEGGRFYFHHNESRPIILDGGVGDEVRNRAPKHVINDGFRAVFDAPEILKQVHTDFANAGAQVMLMDTFGVNLHNSNQSVSDAQAWVRGAFNTVNAVNQRHGVHAIAGSIRPLGDCYTPEDTPDNQTLMQTHKQHIQVYKDIGFFAGQGNYLQPETMPTLREAEIIADIIDKQHHAPFLISFVVDGESGALLDGHKMDEVVNTILQPHLRTGLGIGLNCCSLEGAKKAVLQLRAVFEQRSELQDKEIFVYPNAYKSSREESGAGTEWGDHGDTAQGVACGTDGHCDHDDNGDVLFTPQEFASGLSDLFQAGATAIGGCCGATPAHIRELNKIFIQRDYNFE